MAFNNPEAFWLLLALPVLFIIGGILSLFNRRDKSRFSQPELYQVLTRSISKTRRGFRWIMYILGMIFLIVALTGPRFGTKTEIVKHMGVDIVIALDTSYSMLAEDVKPNRINQAKYEIHRLLNNLKGDRVALIAFAGKSFVQCPLTTDYSAAKTLLDNIDIGIISEPGTDIGGAIAGSVKLLQNNSGAGSESRLVILFTDGENLSGNPERAAKDAASQDIRIYTVGIGTTGGEIIPIRNEKGQLEDYKKDSKGNVVKTALDEKILRNISQITHGSYIRTRNGEVDIQVIIDQLGDMNKTDIHERKISRLKERYQVFLGLSLFFLLIWLMTSERRHGIYLYRLREIS